MSERDLHYEYLELKKAFTDGFERGFREGVDMVIGLLNDEKTANLLKPTYNPTSVNNIWEKPRYTTYTAYGCSYGKWETKDEKTCYNCQHYKNGVGCTNREMYHTERKESE